MEEPLVAHADVRAFAEDHVNLPADYARRYRAQVESLKTGLEAHIADKPGFGLVKMLNAGSVAKGTALRSINDLDVAVYVKKDGAPAKEKDLVDWIRELLIEVYPSKSAGDFESRERCVRINFRQSGLDVDVVPIIHDGGKGDSGYLVDKHTGERTYTDVNCHLRFIRVRKGRDPNFAQVVRLAKWWAKQRKDENPEFKCKSFMVELMVARMVDAKAQLGDYPSALEQFFSWMARTGLEEQVAFADNYQTAGLPRSKDPISVLDPVNPDNNVASRYSIGDREALVGAAQDAADAIREAYYSSTKSRAVERWQAVLGPSFRG